MRMRMVGPVVEGWGESGGERGVEEKAVSHLVAHHYEETWSTWRSGARCEGLSAPCALGSALSVSWRDSAITAASRLHEAPASEEPTQKFGESRKISFRASD